jgi:predicted HAD superfamily Cof-like phosphohydrolase
MPETSPNTEAMPDRIWVRCDDTALGPFEVSSVADPEGLARIESGWTEYAPAEQVARERRISEGEARLSRGRAEEVAALAHRAQTLEEVGTDTAIRLGLAVRAQETLIADVERDRREPDKLLCHVASARRRLGDVCSDLGGPVVAPSFMARALAEFHEHPNALPETTNTQALRRTLHVEEHEELMDALGEAMSPLAPGSDRIKLAQVARELADVVYVAYGTAWAFGIDLDAALAEIHRCAMVKMAAGLRREDGKILKPPGFEPPDMTAAIANAKLEVRDA